MLIRFSGVAFGLGGPFPLVSLAFFTFSEGLMPLVSGNATKRNKVSAARRTSVMKAGSAYILSSTPQELIDGGKGLEAKYAPIGGPTQKQMAKAMPTWASALERLAAVVTSERIALAETS